MTRTSVARLSRLALRGSTIGRVTAISHQFNRLPITTVINNNIPNTLAIRGPFSTSSRLASPLSTETFESATIAELSDAEYHAVADEYLDKLLEKYEALADERTDIDVEYHSGVMNITYGNAGTYVLNKQPPNKQIWLSSPKSGPKRFDYVVVSESQDHKQDTATGGWVYMRDGTELNELLFKETGVRLAGGIDDSYAG